MATTLLDINDEIRAERTLKALTLFRRVHICQEMMTFQLVLLETMSPKDYQEIRTFRGIIKALAKGRGKARGA